MLIDESTNPLPGKCEICGEKTETTEVQIDISFLNIFWEGNAHSEIHWVSLTPFTITT